MAVSQWQTGTSLRMSRLFNDASGKSVVIAMDHGFIGVYQGLENPGKVLDSILAGKPDAVLVAPGTARMFQSHLAGRSAPAMIVTIDYVMFTTIPTKEQTHEEMGVLSTVEDALRMGADAVKVAMTFGRKDATMQARNFDMISQVADKCHQWGMPLMIEPTTWGKGVEPKDTRNAQILANIARIAFEFGADIVKVDYPESAADFKQIAAVCPAPIMVLGGTKKPDQRAMLEEILTVTKLGSSGVVIGRNVWQWPNPSGMVRALRQVVHNCDLEAAMAELEK
jgi:DhnA family fructose-bisphosphate aldolase class Ia